ncbi:PIF1-like helicase domain-containing protein [Apiospora kogelbergensis]|uniref:PIF1-like helicase domain-containing protein n=1 Tax=Apiospora kogelbergensis TaxID=1337665 RepID=UPI00312D862A
MATEETAQRVFELRLTDMFPIDKEAAIAEQDKLAFVGQMLQNERRDGGGGNNSIPGDADEGGPPSTQVHSSREQPFIRVSRGGDFADALSPDFFPKTFPTCFPHGQGGPRAGTGGAARGTRRLPFLAFNILLRSRNRQLAHGRLQRPAFRRVEGIYDGLTPERLQRAESEMRETGRTTDPDVLAIMKELSLYGSRHPLSNESRLYMRKKILALIVASGLTAVWFTINPNDINNPVKLKLAAHRGLDDAAARALLEDLRTSLQAATLSIHDPLGSTVFFFREIQLFFEHYVRVGRPSVFGKVSDYYATVETNDRGALHLHGLLWFDANVGMPELLRDMANPREAEYRAKVRRFVGDVFTESLDEALAQAASDQGRKTTAVPAEATQDTAELAAAFAEEAHFVASRCQVHHHSAICVKYSFKDAVKDGGEKRIRTLCRFGASWKLVPETGFSEDGLLTVERNHPMVNRYNQSMAVGLHHNHDITLILTRSMGLALMLYICNYATKLSAPMWKRLAIASELLTLIDQQ